MNGGKPQALDTGNVCTALTSPILNSNHLWPWPPSNPCSQEQGGRKERSPLDSVHPKPRGWREPATSLLPSQGGLWCPTLPSQHLRAGFRVIFKTSTKHWMPQMSVQSRSQAGPAVQSQGELSSHHTPGLRSVLKADVLSFHPRDYFFLRLFQLIEAKIRTGKSNTKVKSAWHWFGDNTLWSCWFRFQHVLNTGFLLHGTSKHFIELPSR